MRNVRRHPDQKELHAMTDRELSLYAMQEAYHLEDQKQTAVPRLIRELVARL